MKTISKRSYWFILLLVSVCSTTDLFIPNFDPIILKNLNIEYEWFENLLESNTIETDCQSINSQIPSIEFAYNTISNFSLDSTETMKDLENIRKLMGSLEIALDQQYEEKIINETLFAEELSNVQRELKRKISDQVLQSNLSQLSVIQWTNDLNETEYISKISEETYLLQIKKEILSKNINNHSQSQTILIKDATNTITKLQMLLDHYFELYENSKNVNQQMILITQLNQYIIENELDEFDTENLKQTYQIMRKDFQQMQNQVQSVQKLYIKMKNLLTQILQKVEFLSNEKETSQKEQLEINDLIQKYQILSGIFQGIQKQEESNKTLSQLLEKSEYLMNYQKTLENLDNMYFSQINEIQNELETLDNTSYVYRLKQDTVWEILDQQKNLQNQLSLVIEESSNTTNLINKLQQEQKEMASAYSDLEQKQQEINKQISQLEQNISKIQNWLHNSLEQIQNYTEMKLAIENKLESLKKQNDDEGLKKAQYNIKVISEWLPEEQKKYQQYQKYEETLFQEINRLHQKQEEINEKMAQYQVEEESSKLQFYSFIESQSKFINNNNENGASQLDQLLYQSQKAMSELNRLKEGQSLLLQEYEKLVKEKEEKSSISNQFQSFLEMKGFDIYSDNRLIEPEFKAIIQSDEFKEYQKSQEQNFIQKQKELLSQQQILAKLNQDIATKEDELQTISYNVDACVYVCSTVAHKSQGEQLSEIGSEISNEPIDYVSSHIEGYMKAKVSLKDNYIQQKPEVYGKQFGEQNDDESGKSDFKRYDLIKEKEKEMEKNSWSSTKSIGDFYSNITTAITIFINPNQNNITSSIIIFYDISSNVSSEVKFFEAPQDRKQNKSINDFSDKIKEKHTDLQEYDFYNSKANLLNEDSVSSHVKITWNSIVDSIMEGGPEDEVSSKIILDGTIQTSTKSYSGKIQDSKDIQSSTKFKDSVSSKAISKQLKNKISNKENYPGQKIVVVEAIYGKIEESISMRQSGKVKNAAYSTLSGLAKDSVSSKAIGIKQDSHSELTHEVHKDKKNKKSHHQFTDKLAIAQSTKFLDKVSSKAYPKPQDRKDNENIWKKQKDSVSSKAISPKNKHFIKARYVPHKDSVSSKVISQLETIIHVHQFKQSNDVISVTEKVQLISKYAMKKYNEFHNKLGLKTNPPIVKDQVSSKVIKHQKDQISSKNITLSQDKLHIQTEEQFDDQVSSTVYSTQKSLYAIKTELNIIDKVSSKVYWQKQDSYTMKTHYKFEDKLNMQSDFKGKDSVSSRIHGETLPKIASKIFAEFQDEVSSKVIGSIQPKYASKISTEMKDSVSSKIISKIDSIITSSKSYSGAIIDEVAGSTTFMDYIWYTITISFIEQPTNNITSDIIIFSEFMTNVTTSIIKFAEIQNNITSSIIIYENIENIITTDIVILEEMEDEVSSKIYPGGSDKISSKSFVNQKDSVSSRVHKTEIDEVNSKVIDSAVTLISGAAKKKIIELISVNDKITLTNKHSIKSSSPQVIPKYSGKQKQWPRSHTYSGMITKCDCEDEVSSIIEAIQQKDLYSKEKIESKSDLISSGKSFTYENIIGTIFGGLEIDEVSSTAIYTAKDIISGGKKYTDTAIISCIISEGDIEDEVSSTVYLTDKIQTSFHNYSGKVMDYKEIKSEKHFKDYISSKINDYIPTNKKSIKSRFTQTDAKSSKTSFKKQTNITTSIIFFSELQNNITSQLVGTAKINNISSSIKIFTSIDNQITTEILIFKNPEEEVSSKVHETLISIYSNIISWIEFEDEVSSKVMPGTEEDEVHSIINNWPGNEISEKEKYTQIDKIGIIAEHNFQEKIHFKSYGKLVNRAASETSFKYHNNITTDIIEYNPIEISNITTHIKKYEEMTNNITTLLIELAPLEINNISTCITDFNKHHNITTQLIKFASVKLNNITSSIIIYKEQENLISTGFVGEASNDYSNKIYDGGIEQDESASKTTFKAVSNITSDVVFFADIQNFASSEIIIFSLENLIASKTSKKSAINNITTNIVFFGEITNNITTKITQFQSYNNISSDIKIFHELQSNITTKLIELISIEDEVHSKAITSLINIVTSIISDLELEDEVSSTVIITKEDTISIKDQIPLPIDYWHSISNVENQNKTARQSLVDYWLCDYVGEVFSYVNHKTSANVPGLQEYSNDLNSNTLIATARHLALLLKNATQQKSTMNTNNIDQLLKLTNQHQDNTFNIHYYQQFRELLKAVKKEIDQFYLVLAKQQELYSKRRAFKSLLDNLSIQKDKCMIKKQSKSFLRKR